MAAAKADEIDRPDSPLSSEGDEKDAQKRKKAPSDPTIRRNPKGGIHVTPADLKQVRYAVIMNFTISADI
jgi:hypothetical protein